MASVLDLKFLLFVPRYFALAAFAAWLITLIGMLRHIHLVFAHAFIRSRHRTDPKE